MILGGERVGVKKKCGYQSGRDMGREAIGVVDVRCGGGRNTEGWGGDRGGKWVGLWLYVVDERGGAQVGTFAWTSSRKAFLLHSLTINSHVDLERLPKSNLPKATIAFAVSLTCVSHKA